jgi:hypothetical protein
MSIDTLDARHLSSDWLSASSRRRMAMVAVAVVGVSLLMTRLVLDYSLIPPAGLIACVILVAIMAQPRFGLYVAFATILMFEVSSLDSVMLPGVYLLNSLQSTLSASGGVLIPMEMLLLLATVVWLAQALMRQRLGFRLGVLGRPVLLLFLVLLFAVVRGLAAGAQFNYSLWESRFLFWMILCYLLAANTIRTKEHVHTLLTLITLGVGFSGIEGAWRRLVLIESGALGSAQEGWYAHDSVVVWGLLIMLVFARIAFGGPRWQRIVGPILLIITGYTMLASERRAGYIAVMIAFAAFALVLLFAKRRAFFAIAAPIILATAIYMPLFWNNTGTFGQPARAVRSLSQPDPRDAASNLARDLEAVNVRATIASDPLIGIGFGIPFLQVVAIPDISGFPFWNYEAHHDILWVWMKAGAIGFILFFTLMGRGLMRATRLTLELSDPNARVFAIVTLSAVVMSLVFCYVDLGLTGSRVPVILGTLLGTLSVFDRIYSNRLTKGEPN